MKNQKGFVAAEGFLLAIIVLMIGGVGWYVYQAKQNSDKSLQNATQTETKAETAKSDNATQDNKAREEAIEKIIKAFNNRDRSLLESHMASSVRVTMQSTDASPGSIERKEAASSVLNYLENADLPWKFEGNGEIIAKIKESNYSGLVNNATVGISQDDWFISFKLDSNNKINEVHMSVNYDLMLMG